MDIYTLALSIAYSNKIGKQIKEELAFKIQIESNRDILNTTGEEKIFYFLPKENGKPQNGYDEYIFFNNNWELMGSTEIDLSNYYTKTEINTKLTKAESTDNKVTSLSSSSTDTQYPSAKAVYDKIQSLNIPDMEIKVEKQYSLVQGYCKIQRFHFIKVNTFPTENIQPVAYLNDKGLSDNKYFYINSNNIVQGYLSSDLAYVASQRGLTMPEGWYSILVFLQIGFNNPNVKYNGVITNLSDNYEIDSTTGEKDETVFNVLEEYKGIYGIINDKQYKLDNLHIEYKANNSSQETDIQYSFGDMRIFIESANLYCGNEIVNTVNVLMVNTFPSANNAYPVIDNDSSFNFYYNYFTKELKGFIPSQLASNSEFSEGWYDYQFCADVTNRNIKYLGIVDNLNFSPTFYDFSENIAKSQVGLYLNKKLQYWDGFKWQTINNIENIASGTGEKSLIFNDCINSNASGGYSHAEGYHTIASGDHSHAEGESTTASGSDSHAEGESTTASGSDSHAEGESTTASGSDSHTEGCFTTASGGYSHAEGYKTTASETSSHAEGYQTTASETSSHAEGYQTTASGHSSHTEGCFTTASGGYSHAEGYKTTASGGYSHAEGYKTTASETSSHAEGDYTTASGYASHAEGYQTTASGSHSHAEGVSTIAQRRSQHVFGECNIADTTNNNGQWKGSYIEIVGNGTDDNTRSNARTLDWSGNEVLAGKLTVGVAPTNDMDVTTKQYVDTALDLKASLASPALTGTPTAPTAAAGTNTTQIATTAFVQNADVTTKQYVDTALDLKASLASPALTGTPTAPTAAAGTNTTQIATTAFVQNADVTTKQYVDTALDLKASLASPALTGTPTAPTAAAGTNTTQIATTAFVQNALADIETLLAQI